MQTIGWELRLAILLTVAALALVALMFVAAVNGQTPTPSATATPAPTPTPWQFTVPQGCNTFSFEFHCWGY